MSAFWLAPFAIAGFVAGLILGLLRLAAVMGALLVTSPIGWFVIALAGTLLALT